MSDPNLWIKERRRIHGAATGGWEYDEDDGGHFWAGGGRSDFHLTPEDAAAAVDAHATLPALLTAVEKVLELHQPVTRYSLVGYEDWSFDSFDEVREFTGEDDLPGLEEFQLCAECRRVEDGAADNTAEIGYETSLWPCPTVRAIEGAING